MKELKIQSFVKIRKYRSYKGNFGLVAKNLLNRNFKANKPIKNGLQILHNLLC